MKVTQLASGLVVPEQKPAPPAREYAPLELQCPEQREAANKALRDLYDAMDLERWRFKDRAAYEAHSQAWDYLAMMLLGDDRPEMEQLT